MMNGSVLPDFGPSSLTFMMMIFIAKKFLKTIDRRSYLFGFFGPQGISLFLATSR